MKTKLIQTKRMLDLRQEVVQNARSQEHDTFAVMAGQCCASLPLSRMKLNGQETRQVRRRRIVTEYSESMRLIAHMANDIDSVLRAVVTTYIWCSDSDPQHRMYAEKLHAEIASIPAPVFEVVDSLFAEIMVHDEERITKELSTSLEETLTKLFMSFRDRLKVLQDRRVVGRVSWLSQDVCRYDFYRIRRLKRKQGESIRKEVERKTERNPGAFNGGTFTDYEVTRREEHYGVFDVHEHHTHELYNAARYQFPAKTVKKPTFVVTLLKMIPAWMRQHIFIVEGDMLREEIKKTERMIRSRQNIEELGRKVINTGVFYSPAVTLGEFVLTGWSGRDL